MPVAHVVERLVHLEQRLDAKDERRAGVHERTQVDRAVEVGFVTDVEGLVTELLPRDVAGHVPALQLAPQSCIAHGPPSTTAIDGLEVPRPVMQEHHELPPKDEAADCGISPVGHTVVGSDDGVSIVAGRMEHAERLAHGAQDRERHDARRHDVTRHKVVENTRRLLVEVRQPLQLDHRVVDGHDEPVGDGGGDGEAHHYQRHRAHVLRDLDQDD